MSSRHALLIGSVASGALTVSTRELASALRGWPDGRVEVLIRPEKRDRTSRQLRYYWGRVLPLIAEETGQDAESIHDDLCERFLTRRRVAYVNPTTGEIDEREVARRTTGLSVAEFFEFTELVRVWAGEWLGIEIPPPDGEPGRGIA